MDTGIIQLVNKGENMPSLMNGLFRVNAIPQKLFFTSGSGTLYLPAGYYRFVLRGAGGAGGGDNRPMDADLRYTSGRGGRGKLTVVTRYYSTPQTLNYYIGDAGLTYPNNGNGGLGGYESVSKSYAAPGGGGGKPTYIYINNEYIHALGGGGGGGASEFLIFGWAPGGAGGGYYRFSNGVITSVPGKNSASVKRGAGTNGNTVDFPSLYGAHGANIYSGNTTEILSYGGVGGIGGGASGGAGTEYSHAGSAGGGGAGGDLEAGGGAGDDTVLPNIYPATINAGLWQGLTTTAENAQYGITGNYGSGGDGEKWSSNSLPGKKLSFPTNGIGGCFLIERL